MSLSVPTVATALPIRHQVLVARFDWRQPESIIMAGLMPKQEMEQLLRAIIKPGDPPEVELLLLQTERLKLAMWMFLVNGFRMMDPYMLGDHIWILYWLPKIS